LPSPPDRDVLRKSGVRRLRIAGVRIGVSTGRSGAACSSSVHAGIARILMSVGSQSASVGIADAVADRNHAENQGFLADTNFSGKG